MTGICCVIPVSIYADWYACRVGVAAAREINTIPAGRHATEESIFRPAGMSRPLLKRAVSRFHAARCADGLIRIRQAHRRLRGGQPYTDSGTFAFLAFDDQLSAVAIDNVLDDRKPKAGTADRA